MEIKTTKFSSFDGLELKEATFKNHIFPDHYHDCYSIGIIEKGIEKICFPAKEILVHAHSIIIINPYDIHSNRFFDHDSWKYRILYINTDVMKFIQSKYELFSNKTVWFPQYLIDDLILYQLILNFHFDINQDNTYKLHTIINYLIKNYASCKQENECHSCSNEINDILEFIQLHLYDKMALNQLAAKCHMDKYKFIRAFKKQVGLTPASYILLLRINKAKSFISNNMPMTEVALETGFYDQSHFTHYSKKYIGIAPLQYKKGIRIE